MALFSYTEIISSGFPRINILVVIHNSYYHVLNVDKTTEGKVYDPTTINLAYYFCG